MTIWVPYVSICVGIGKIGSRKTLPFYYNACELETFNFATERRHAVLGLKFPKITSELVPGNSKTS